MTQSIAFIRCENEETEKKYEQILQHPLYVFINNICRWGNFNNVRILQRFPLPNIIYDGDQQKIYDYFKLNYNEINYITTTI